MLRFVLSFCWKDITPVLRMVTQSCNGLVAWDLLRCVSSSFVLGSDMADRLAEVPLAHSEIVSVAPSEMERGYSVATGEFTIEATEGKEKGACWGAEVHGGVNCPPDFVPGKLHFKNKFCDSCRNAIMVPLSQLRALSEEQAACVVNKRSEGFWNSAPANMGGGQYRILNNTAGCIGPWLALFREQPPNIQW